MTLTQQNHLLATTQHYLVPPPRSSTPKSSSSSHSLQTTQKHSPPSGVKANSAKFPKLSDESKVKFKLPAFSPDIETCIRKDAFYTFQQQNKLIPEACRALQGHCREQDQATTNDDK